MPSPRHPRDRHWLRRTLLWAAPADNVRGVVLGTLTIGALLAAEGTRNDTYEETAGAVALLLVMYWISHGYSTALGDRIEEGRAWSAGSTLEAMRREFSILRGGLVPLVTLIVCWVSGVSLGTGVVVAIVATGATIIVLEVMAGVRASLGVTEIVADTVLGAMLGVGLLAVKIILH
jgi:hypothetical protein